MTKKIPVKNLYLIAIISIGLIGLAVGSTYAMFTATAEINNPISLSSNLTYTSDIVETMDVTVAPGETEYVILDVTNSTDSTLNYAIWYIDEGYDIDFGTDLENPDDTTSGIIGAGSYFSIGVYIRNNGTSIVKVTLGVSSSVGNIVLADNMKILPNSGLPAPKNLVKRIEYLYNSATKTPVINNNITYNYATNVSLMNDRLGGTTTSLDGGNIRYYGANPNNYADIGDVYKNDITKGKWEELGVAFATEEECKEFSDCSINYAELGYSSEEECNSNLPILVQDSFGMTIEEFNNTYCVVETIPKGTPILYRIIGVFGDKVKLIRNESIGVYSWDTSASDVNFGYGINEWSQADLMKLLNPGYESNTDLNSSGTSITVNNSLYYNSGSGTCYNDYKNATKSCDFTSTGIKNDTTRNMISESTYYLGGGSSAEIYSNAALTMERGTTVISSPRDGITRTTSWTGKIGLMYPSDYGYATDFTKCSQTLYNYDSSTDSYACRSNDWLYNGADQWLLTPNSSNGSNAWYVNSTGGVNYGGSVSLARGVRPVLYLKSELVIESGSGTEGDPYRISA